MIRGAAALALLWWSGALGAQTIRMADAGPGPGPALLERELTRPYVVIPPAATHALLRRDSTYDRTVIVLGRDAAVEGMVHGDVVVVGGDLFMHPGAAVTGRLIAFGGGVYLSSLATQGGDVAYRDFTYDVVAEPGGYALSYRPLAELSNPPFALAGLYGLAVPAYDRSNGVSVPVGVDLSPLGRLLLMQPRLTYRSQLGRIDPSLGIADSLDRRTAVRAWMGRGTFTNDAWIWSDLVNSAEYLVLGHDSRNYYRGTRERVTIERAWETAAAVITPYVGAQHEHAGSVRPLAGATSSPWTLVGRHDEDDALRPNIEVETRAINSLLAGVRVQWTPGDIVARLASDAELASTGGGAQTRPTLAQLTLDGAIAFPTFGTQRLSFDAHALASTSGAPRSRYAFVGGAGTLPTVDMLALGGDELVYLDARYDVPVERVQVPVVGAPVLTLREVLAGAAVDRWPTLEQGIGPRASFGPVYVEFLVDPVHRRGRFSFGLSARP